MLNVNRRNLVYSGKPKGAGGVHVVSLCCAVTQLLQLLLVTHFVCVLSSHPSHVGTCPCPGCPSPKLGWCKAKPVLGQTEGHVCSLCCSTDWRALRCLGLDPSAGHCLVSLALTSSLFGPVMLRDLTLGMEVTVFPLIPQNQEVHTGSLWGQNCCQSAVQENPQVCRSEDTHSF